MPTREDCRLCGSKDLTCFLSFGDMPLAGEFPKKDELEQVKLYPLDTYFCNSCKGVQILDIIPRETFFKDYRYLSSVTKTLIEHFTEYAKEVKDRFSTFDGYVVEIGCNDGVLLDPLKKENVKALGVDPAINIVQITKEKGLDVVNDFFGKNVSSKIIEQYGQADVVIANQVFAHVDDLDDMTQGAFNVLKDDGVFIIEIHYIADIIKDLGYDMIYHEHMCYFSVQSMLTFLKKYDMEIFDIKHLSIRGGSIRVYVKKTTNSKFPILPSVDEILKEEEKMKVNSLETYLQFAKDTTNHKETMISMLQKLKSEGKKIVGYGMSGRASTMLNFWKIDTKTLDYGIDASPERYDRFVPVMQIPILKPHPLNDVDCVLLLAWIFKKEIMEKEASFVKKGGTFLVPLPKPHFSP